MTKHGNLFVFSANFSPDGTRIVSGGTDNVIRVWDPLTGEVFLEIPHKGNAVNISFSPDGKQIMATALNDSLHHRIQVWDAVTGKEIVSMRQDDKVTSAIFNPTGNYIFSISNEKKAYVWNVTTGQEIAQREFEFNVIRAEVDPNSNYVLIGGDDGVARIVDIPTLRDVALMTHGTNIIDIAWGPNGKYAVSASKDGVIRMWLWRPSDLIVVACSRLPRNLTLAEWQNYVEADIPYHITCDPAIYPNAIIPEDAQAYLNSQ